jgi:stearoyl-CoA desaturase (delta-9 desaturase)
LPAFHPLLGVVVGLLLTQLAITATTVYLHRGLAHRGLEVHPVAALPLRFFLWMTTGMRPREWAAVHRRHHAATDTIDDPHSPIIHGFWRVQLANAALYRKVARDGTTVDKYARDIKQDRWDKVLFDHAFLGLGIGVVLLCLVLGWPTGLLAAGVHAVAYLGLSGAVNAVGHTRGTRPYENSATNGRVLALITAGEGLHNNHHAAPTSARFSFRPSEIDPGWWAVRGLTTLKLAKVRHSEPRMRRTGATTAGGVTAGTTDAPNSSSSSSGRSGAVAPR